MTPINRRWVLSGMSILAAVIANIQRSPTVSLLAVVIGGCCLWLIISSLKEKV